MKMVQIFQYEFVYLLQRTTTWLYAAVLLLFTFVMNGLITPGDGVFTNNTFHITAITVIGGLIWLVMGASIAGEAAARDVKFSMHPLTYTTPVTKLHYLGGRFFAALAVNALLVLLLPLGVLLSFYLPIIGGGELLPFRPLAYASVYLLIALPHAFIATAIQFCLAALSRQVMTAFLASLLLALVAQVIAIAAAHFFGNWDLPKLLDPVGVSGIIGSELATWTPTEKNTRLVRLEGMFLWNRVLWMGIATGLLALTFRKFGFANPAANGWWHRFRQRKKTEFKSILETATIKPTAIIVAQAYRSFGWATNWGQALAISGASFKKMACHPVGLTLVGSLALASAIFGSQIMTQMGIPLTPTTQQVLAYLAQPVGNISTPWVVVPLLIMYFSGELVWREKESGLGDIMDASPVSEWALFAGKFLGLVFIIAMWMGMMMAGGIGMQAALGYDGFQIGLYLQVLFGLQLTDYLLFALLALVVHVVINQKIIGHLVVLLVFLFMAFSSTLGIEHPMLVYGKDGGRWYTDMRGFGPTLGPWLWAKVYWTGWALLLAVMARVLWVRGKEQHIKYRLHLARRRFTKITNRVAIMGAILLLAAGSYIFYNTNVLNTYKGSTYLVKQKAAYEKQYSQYKNATQPVLTATKLHVEMYPGQQQVEIRAMFTLVNKENTPIDSIHLGSAAGIPLDKVAFSRPAAAVLVDNDLGFHIYALQQPLLPGDSLQLNFVVRHKQNGFQHETATAWMVENGTHFTNFDLLPAIGYQRYRELNDAVLRKKHGLAARPALPSLYDTTARTKPFTKDMASFEAIVGTSMSEVAVAPGKLLKTWTAGNRRYFHYKTRASIGGEFSILSAKYAVQEKDWNGVAIRIYYHPGHAQNIDRMLRSAAASLTHYTGQFGPYPFDHLTLVERAGTNGSGASADAGIIYYGEQYALMHPDDGPNSFDLPYYILAHEVAHQWWGMARLTPAYVEGAGVLIEGLAVYSGMQVLEKTYGAGHLQQYVGFLHSFYEMPRSLATPSLLQANQDFLYYRKGGLALYALGKYIGKEKVNAALRILLQKHDAGVQPLPTTLDLYRELQQVTPDSLSYLLHDLFKQNTYWRLKTKSFAATPTKEGKWQVDLKVQAQKVVVDLSGQEHEVPMNDWLEIGLYEKEEEANKPLYLQMHRIRSGEQTIKITVPKKPVRAGIDPHQLMIDLRLDDNIIQLEE